MSTARTCYRFVATGHAAPARDRARADRTGPDDRAEPPVHRRHPPGRRRAPPPSGADAQAGPGGGRTHAAAASALRTRRCGWAPIRTSFRAACGSAWRSRWRCWRSRSCWWRTNPPPHSTPRWRRRSRACSRSCGEHPGRQHRLHLPPSRPGGAALRQRLRAVRRHRRGNRPGRRRHRGTPKHPYTRALLDCEIDAGGHGRRSASSPARCPTPAAAVSGCIFAPRCPLVQPQCRRVVAALDRSRPRGSGPPASWWPMPDPLLAAEAVRMSVSARRR